MGVAMTAVAAMADEKSVQMLDLAAGLLAVTVFGFGHLIWARRYGRTQTDSTPCVRADAVTIVLATAPRLEFAHVLAAPDAPTIGHNGTPILAIEE